MIRPGVLLAAMGSLVFLWHECGQDAGVFCYRIGWGAVAGLHTRALVPAYSRASFQFSALRNRSECLTQSFSSSVRCSTPTDSEN
jgi:hypothetical protein